MVAVGGEFQLGGGPCRLPRRRTAGGDGERPLDRPAGFSSRLQLPFAHSWLACMTTEIRHNWSLDEIRAIHDSPLEECLRGLRGERN